MSNKREREKRREERLAEEAKVGSSDRRKKLLQVGAGAAFLAVVAVVALIVASSGDGGGDAGNIKDADVVNQELNGIQQAGMVLGDPKAPVELIEYGDLQCPACKAYAEEILPPIFDGPVTQGQAKIHFKNFTIIGPESIDAGAAAIAAGNQDKAWNFIEIFYKNQGQENDGYVTDDFLTAIAEAAGVADIAKWNEDRNSQAVRKEVEETSGEAQRLGISSTPTFLIQGPATEGPELIEAGSPEQFEEAINAAS